MLVMRLPIRLAWNWSMKKRVPESMPALKALALARIEHMEERARWGTFCYWFNTKPEDLAKRNDSLEKVLVFQSGVV